MELGSGNGQLSNLLLRQGLRGVGFDLNSSACANNAALNHEPLLSGRYKIENSDFMQVEITEKVDIVISSMVLEHLSDQTLDRYFEKCKVVLNSSGLIISLVPSSEKHWGIEDDIAGHLRRFSFESFEKIAAKHSLKLVHSAGLTYPLSNWLLPLSNYLVRRAESSKLKLTQQQRTISSGNRSVFLKARFPSFFRYLINRVTLAPFIWLQAATIRNPNALVIYNELSVH